MPALEHCCKNIKSNRENTSTKFMAHFYSEISKNVSLIEKICRAKKDIHITSIFSSWYSINVQFLFSVTSAHLLNPLNIILLCLMSDDLTQRREHCN